MLFCIGTQDFRHRAFLCAELEISARPREDHAGHFADWLEVIREDAGTIFVAGARASEAASYLFGR